MTKRKSALLAAAADRQAMASSSSSVGTHEPSISPSAKKPIGIVEEVEFQLPGLTGSWQRGIHGTVPCEVEKLVVATDEVNLAHYTYQSFLPVQQPPQPSSFQNTQVPNGPIDDVENLPWGTPTMFRQSLNLQASQQEDLYEIDWDALIGEVEDESQNVAGTSSIQVNDFQLSTNLDSILPSFSDDMNTIVPGSYLYDEPSN